MRRFASILAAALVTGAAPVPAFTAQPAPKSAPAKTAAKPVAAKPARPGAETYSRWIEDLPVMPGLTETDGGYSFEIAQGGRLAEARLHGVLDAEGVRSFYASALPPLGWQAENSQPFLYRRGRERLIFHVSDAKPRGVMAVFVLSPRAGGQAAAPPAP